MNQDRGASRRPRTARALLNVLVTVALLALGSVVSVPAASATTDDGESTVAWPARWSDYTHVDGTPVADVDDDVPSSLDLASGACPTCAGPARSVAWASDGSNAFFRVRLATDITDHAGRDVPTDRFLVQIADRRGEVQAVVGVVGTDLHPTVYVSDAAGDVVKDVHESAMSPRDRTPAGARVVAAADDSGQFLLEFHVPLSVIATVSGDTVTDSTPVKLYYGSSAAADLTTDGPAAITSDFMLGDADSVDFSTLATVRLAGKQHHVGFDTAGGSRVADETVAEGFSATAPAEPSRPGHTFSGWFKSADGGSAYDFGTAITGATTIHAQWDRDSYPVTFDSTGGSPVADQTVLHGDTVEMPADPRRAEHTFRGWFTAATGGKALDAVEKPVTEPTAVYAHWRVKDTTTTALDDSAMPPVRDDAPPVTSAQPGRPSNPVVVEEQGPRTEAADETPPATPSTQEGSRGSEKDATTLDGWDALQLGSAATTNAVEFDARGGSTVDPQTVAAGDTAAVPVEPTRVGYDFVGWFATADGKAKWDFTLPIDEPTTIYAQWTLIGDDVAEDPAISGGDPGGVDDDRADGDGERNGGATLPNTGNQVPQGLLPAAVVLLVLGCVLMTWERRRPGGAAPGPA